MCVCGFSFVSLLFSQQQLKNLQAALGSRLEESLCIINEKVPFNDTSTYCLGLGFLFDFLGYPSGGSTPYELKCLSCKKVGHLNRHLEVTVVSIPDTCHDLPQ